jgi:hypothetical protein
MLRLSEDWASDAPDIPAQVVDRLEEFTEDIWNGFVAALADTGIGL